MEQGKATDVETPGRKRVGGYILGDTIGEGSFAKVRVGTHIMTQEKVAIKIIDKKLIAKRDYVQKNLRREAAMLQKLNHVNITKLYEVLETQNNYYLVMELAEGGEFMRYLCDRKKLSEGEARKFMRQLVSSVEYMHQAELVHRDIKIENFLLDEDNNLKVIDFGLSNVLGPVGFLRTQCGSPAYAAPEIFCSTSYGPAVDVWSIGVNMYAMLTGELPFTVDPPTNVFKLHSKIMQGCNFPEYLTKDCKDLLSRLLKADEASRIKLGDVMKHTWMNYGCSQRLRACSYPNKLTEDYLNRDVISYMAELDFPEKVVIEHVLENKPAPDHAMYHLLVKRLAKGWGYPEKLTAHVQYRPIDATQSDITPISFRPSARRLTKNARPKCSRRNNGSEKTKVDDKNEINKRSNELKEDTVISDKQNTDKFTNFHGVTFEVQKRTPTKEEVLEDMTNNLKEIDLNNNNNNNHNSNNNESNNNSKVTNKNEKIKMDKPKPNKKTWQWRAEESSDDISRGTSDSSQRDSGAQKRHTDTDKCNVVSLSESFSEPVTDPCKAQRLNTRAVPYRQQTLFRPTRLQRSASHTLSSNVPLTSPQNDNQQCLIIVNGKLAHEVTKPEGVSMRYRERAKTVNTEGLGLSISTIPKDGLRRSKTDPAIYNFARRKCQESSDLSDFHRRNAFPVHKHGSFGHSQKPSRTISAAIFGFPTRLRSSALGRQVARFDSFAKQKQNVELSLNPSSTLLHQKGTPKVGIRQCAGTLPSIQQ